MQKNGVYESAWRCDGTLGGRIVLVRIRRCRCPARVLIKSILDGLSVLELRSLNEVIEEINLKAYIYYIVCPQNRQNIIVFHSIVLFPSCNY